jgi:hypothetical protein
MSSYRIIPSDIIDDYQFSRKIQPKDVELAKKLLVIHFNQEMLEYYKETGDTIGFINTIKPKLRQFITQELPVLLKNPHLVLGVSNTVSSENKSVKTSNINFFDLLKSVDDTNEQCVTSDNKKRKSMTNNCKKPNKKKAKTRRNNGTTWINNADLVKEFKQFVHNNYAKSDSPDTKFKTILSEFSYNNTFVDSKQFYLAWNPKYSPIMNELSVKMEKIKDPKYEGNPRNTGTHYTYLKLRSCKL